MYSALWGCICKRDFTVSDFFGIIDWDNDFLTFHYKKITKMITYNFEIHKNKTGTDLSFTLAKEEKTGSLGAI